MNRSWTLADIRFIRANIHLSDNELGDHFGVKKTTIFGTRTRHKILRRSTGRFQKGNIPHNKGRHYEAGGRSIETRFKKGNPPPWMKVRKIGEVFPIPDRTGRVYLFIKLPHNKQYPYGRYVWEQANGLLTKSDYIRFKDDNPQNCELSNLMKVTKSEHSIMNNKKKKNRIGKNSKIVAGLIEMGFRVSGNKLIA